MNEITTHITEMNNGCCKLKIKKGYPALVNNENMVNLIQGICKKMLGEENVILMEKPMMGSEDFAYYLKAKIPFAIFWLGCGNEKKGLTAQLHNPCFLPDEDVLLQGTAIQVNLVYQYLNQNG